MGANATCGHRVARLMAPTNSVLIVAPATGLLQPQPACSSLLPASNCQCPASNAHCHGHIRIPRSPSCCSCRCESSSSLLQFCLNYFACLFMVESLISGASVADNLDVVGALRCNAACSYNFSSIHSASAVAACVATIQTTPCRIES